MHYIEIHTNEFQRKCHYNYQKGQCNKKYINAVNRKSVFGLPLYFLMLTLFLCFDHFTAEALES